MAIDTLQSKIRKLKNPTMLAFSWDSGWVPEGLGYENAAGSVLEALKDTLSAVRFSTSSFALGGPEALELQQRLMAKARAMGYYVAMDMPGTVTPEEGSAAGLLANGWEADALIVSAWAGSDGWKGLLPLCKEGKDIFVVVRSANRSAPELQDLITGGRLVHLAAADQVRRSGLELVGKYGYSAVGAVTSATAADINRNLRSKYQGLFLLVDGYDYRGGNGKNCSYAFDKLGHGAAVCAGSSILSAWKEGEDTLEEAARKAAQRMKKNILNYIQIL